MRFFIPQWESLQLSNRLESLSSAWIIAAVAFTASHYFLVYLIWTIILRNLGAQAAFRQTARVYALSLLAKYIPGNIAAYGLRTHLANKAGVPLIISMKSFLLEALLALAAAAAISVPGTMYYFPHFINVLSICLFGGSTLIAIALLVTKRFKTLGLTEFFLNTRKVTRSVNIFFLYLLVWFISGLGHWCLANALGVYTTGKFPELLVAVATSWAAGFVSFFAPAGLGVREAVLYVFVNSWMSEADVLLFVTLSRLLTFGLEVLCTLSCLLCCFGTRQMHKLE